MRCELLDPGAGRGRLRAFVTGRLERQPDDELVTPCRVDERTAAPPHPRRRRVRGGASTSGRAPTSGPSAMAMPIRRSPRSMPQARRRSRRRLASAVARRRRDASKRRDRADPVRPDRELGLAVAVEDGLGVGQRACRGSRPRSRPGRADSTWRAVTVTGNEMTPSCDHGRATASIVARAVDQRVARLDLAARCSPRRRPGPAPRRRPGPCRSPIAPRSNVSTSSPSERRRVDAVASASPRTAVSGKTVDAIGDQGRVGELLLRRPSSSCASSALVAASTSAWVTRGNSSRLPPLVALGVRDVEGQRVLAARDRP